MTISFIFIEAKYGTAKLSSANEDTGLARQMSKEWIEGGDRVIKAVGGDEVLAENILNSDYQRVLAKVAPDGAVTYQKISPDGKLVTGADGIWTP